MSAPVKPTVLSLPTGTSIGGGLSGFCVRRLADVSRSASIFPSSRPRTAASCSSVGHRCIRPSVMMMCVSPWWLISGRDWADVRNTGRHAELWIRVQQPLPHGRHPRRRLIGRRSVGNLGRRWHVGFFEGVARYEWRRRFPRRDKGCTLWVYAIIQGRTTRQNQPQGSNGQKKALMTTPRCLIPET